MASTSNGHELCTCDGSASFFSDLSNDDSVYASVGRRAGRRSTAKMSMIARATHAPHAVTARLLLVVRRIGVAGCGACFPIRHRVEHVDVDVARLHGSRSLVARSRYEFNTLFTEPKMSSGGFLLESGGASQPTPRKGVTDGPPQ